MSDTASTILCQSIVYMMINVNGQHLCLMVTDIVVASPAVVIMNDMGKDNAEWEWYTTPPYRDSDDSGSPDESEEFMRIIHVSWIQRRLTTLMKLSGLYNIPVGQIHGDLMTET